MSIRCKRDERGSALLAVLWLSAALTVIAFSVASTVRAETDRVSTSADGLRASYLASGAVQRAIQWICWGPDYRRPDGSAMFYEWKMPRLNMRFPSGDAIVQMIPESSKMNINFASADDIARVVTAITGDVMQAQQVAAAIVDWRGGAFPGPFDPLYSSLNPTFRARHASIQEIEELLDVAGVTPELFYGNYISDAQGRLYASGGLRDSFSVWGSPGPYDANTVSPALMLAVGVPEQGVAAIVAARQNAPFRNMGDVASLGFPTPRIAVGGNLIWTLRAVARLRRPDGSPSEVVRSAAAVVKMLDPRQYPGNPVHVLRWYDDAWSENEIAPPVFASPMFAPPLPAVPTGAPLP
jgi:general secretion pathway protein K